MKALIVRQPYAALIAAGIKRIENRSWPTAHRGALAIHAARAPADADDLEQLGIGAGELVYGAIVAVVNVTDCIAVDTLPPDLAGDPDAGGPWCWLLADARPVSPPVPCRGRLGLWTAPAFTLTKG